MIAETDLLQSIQLTDNLQRDAPPNIISASISPEGVEALKGLIAYVEEKEKMDVGGAVRVDLGFDELVR